MRGTRIRIDHDGQMEIVDPGFDSLELLTAVDPNFRIRWGELPGFSSPRFLKTRETGCGIGRGELAAMSQQYLWYIHNDIISRLREGDIPSTRSQEEVSLLGVKIELSHRLLSSCPLCAHRCGVDRTRGELGICGLGTEAIVAEQFVHIAEEPPINPSLLISLYGCGLRCRYCQQWELLNLDRANGGQLGASLWDNLDVEGARSISFIGGNPDESLHAILRFLELAPPDWELPVVWNCHGYGSPEVIRLLDGIADVYVPDLKYGDEKCSRELSNAPGYPAAARTTVCAMVAQDVPVIVRILILPGHFRCCHASGLEFLSSLDSETVFVSVRDQYCPDWIITPEDEEMARRPTVDEVERVREMALSLGLNLI